MQKINELLKELEPLAADPKSADALDILGIFRSLRWEVMRLENLIFATKFDKPVDTWCPNCGIAIELGECGPCGGENN